MDQKTFLRSLFDAAVAAADPFKTIAAHLPPPPKGRTLVIGAGKASAEMARALEAHWPTPLEGLVVTRYGHGAETKGIEIVEASHPVPDQAGADAAKRVLKLVEGLTADDLVIALISGGGSSLLPMPLDGLSLADKQAVNKALLKSGATIGEMNCVRRHLSAIKGGRLLRACAPAKVVTLSISDVPGDAPGDIASGPTVPDPTTCADALRLIKKYGIEIPDAVRQTLESGAGETPKPGDPSLPPNAFHLIAAPQASLEAAATLARNAWDHPPHPRRQPGRRSARRGCGHGRHRPPGRHPRAALQHAPCVLLSGGETTVTIRGDRPRRPQRRVPAVAGHRAAGQCKGPRDRRRYRRRRRRRGGGRRDRHPNDAGARLRGRDHAGRKPRAQ